MRRFLSSACFIIGTVWAAAGILKILFGVRLTLPLLPPFGLEQVAIAPSLVTGLILFAIGAVLGRGANVADRRIFDSEALESEALLGEPSVPVAKAARPSTRQPHVR